MSAKKTVFVGLSGGVDSSVAALRLKQRGYYVVGVFIKVWHPDFLVCNWEQERVDAMRVAAHLDIPFLTCDAEAAYRDEVAHYFIDEYIQGRTPNPDVLCNQHVKFGHFLRFAQKNGADYIATGHYTTKIDTSSGPTLHRGVDIDKDQSYFLWTLSNEQLQYSLFPVGDTPKPVIRREAARAKIPVAMKRDSQGICFLGHVDIKDFLSHYTTLTTGDVIDHTGAVVGEHSGALIYTIGQRHGFTMFTTSERTAPHYVIAKNMTENTITVSTTKPTIASGNSITLRATVLRESVTPGDVLHAQTRYRQTPFSVSVSQHTDTELVLNATELSEPATSGQSCVLYRGSCCIGGGIIQ